MAAALRCLRPARPGGAAHRPRRPGIAGGGPGLAHDTDATAAAAAHLWWLVDRPNLFIKIPATQQGLAAITTSIAQGISVNVTLIFSPGRYRAVMDAYLSGLEQRVQDGGSLTWRRACFTGPHL
jgi:hypothetical protein